ncbi:MAG TPA: hypothetical protein VGA36_04620 [Nitriliruptorales bacterium]
MTEAADARTVWRLDATHPDDWDWTPYPDPLHRFDPDDGSYRVRYAGTTAITAARERFATRSIRARDLDLWLVEIRLGGRLLPLTHQRNLDALGVDRRISTGRAHTLDGVDPLMRQCWALATALGRWFDPPIGLRYDARSHASGGSTTVRLGSYEVDRTLRLGDARMLLNRLVILHGFKVES